MTTKRTIMENEQMSIELSYQSRQTEKLLSRRQCMGGEQVGRRGEMGALAERRCGQTEKVLGKNAVLVEENE